MSADDIESFREKMQLATLLAVAERERDEALNDLLWLEHHVFERHWDGTIGRPSTWHIWSGSRHEVAKMRGETLSEAIRSVRCARQSTEGK